MYKKMSAFLLPVLAVAFAAAIFWGYGENRDKNTLMIKAENQYQRAFHDLTYHMDQLHIEIGKALAVDAASHEFQRKSLLNVWRMTNDAMNEINQLPLTLLPFNQTEDFLSKVSSFSYITAMRNLTEQPLNETETKTLQTLYKRSEELTNELRGIQSTILARNLQWIDVDEAMASRNEPRDNTIVDGFQTVNQQVEEYEEVDYGPEVATLFEDRNFSALSGKTMEAREIRNKAKAFFGLKDNQIIGIDRFGEGTRYTGYSVNAGNGQGVELKMDFSQKGGHLLYFIYPRMVNEAKLDLVQARDKAKAFLDKHGLTQMKAISYDMYQNTAVFTLAKKEDNVLIYPAKVTVQVALDNGQIIGYEARDYLFNEAQERTLPKAALTAGEARKKLNPTFDVFSRALVLIENDYDREVLCYEFTGKINGTTYRLYINAMDGQEEKIEPVRYADSGQV